MIAVTQTLTTFAGQQWEGDGGQRHHRGDVMTVKNVVIPLEIEYLQDAAKERGISRTKLVRVVMEKVVRDELDQRFRETDPMGFDPTFVIPGCVPAGDSRSERRPGIHSPCGGYGFRARLCRASRVTRAPE